jgi:hypothetical protein
MGVVALDHDRRRFDAGLFAVRLFDQLDRKAAALGPAHIHAQQHPRPIAAFGAAGAGMDFDVCIVGVGLARQQGFELAPLALRLQRLEQGDSFLFGRSVAFALAKFDQRRRVFEFAFELGQRL